MKKCFVYLILLVFIFYSFQINANYDVWINLLHTNDINLTENPFSSEKSIPFQSLKLFKQNKNVSLLVDAGGFVGKAKYTDISWDFLSEEYDALSVSEYDLTENLSMLVDLYNRGLKIVTGNIYDRNGKKIFDDFIIKDIDGVRVGIFGILLSDVLSEEYSLSNPSEHIQDVVNTLREQTDIIIALVHGNIPNILLESAMADLIVTGGNSTTPSAIKQNDSMIVHAGEFLEHVGSVNFLYSSNIGSAIRRTATFFSNKTIIDELFPKETSPVVAGAFIEKTSDSSFNELLLYSATIGGILIVVLMSLILLFRIRRIKKQ